jgi:hypothetical protein
MNLDTLQTLLRSVFKVGGGYLIAKGLASGDQVETVISGAAVLAAIIWGIMHRNPPPPPTAPAPAVNRIPVLFLLATAATAAASGCAYVRSTTTRAGTNETTTVRAFTIFDGQAQLAKFRNTTGGVGSNGFVFPPGTSIGSLNESSTSSNLPNVIESIAAGVARGLTSK